MGGLAIDGFAFKLLLEGVEIEFDSVSVNIGSGGMSCSIELPPDDSLAVLSVKTLVHLFFKRRDDSSWRLLFNGEVHSFGFRKTSRGDSYSLSCRDITANLNQMYRYFLRKANPTSINAKNKAFFGVPVDSGNDFIDSERAEGSGGVLDNIKYEISDIVTIVKKAIQKMAGVNDFIKKLEEEYKMSERFFSVKDKYLETVFSTKSSESIYEARGFSNMQTMRDILSVVMRDTFYKWCYLSPSSIGKSVREVAVIPDNPMFPAPMCNVVYPNMAQSISFSDNASAKPTRLSMATDPVFTGGRPNVRDSRFTYVAWAPPELKDSPNQQYLHHSLTEEEKVVGIMPAADRVPSFTRLMDLPKTGDNPKYNEHEGFRRMTQTAEYRLGVMRLSTCSANSGSMPFNPYMAQGFTAVVMAEPFIVRGVLETVNHTISKRGLSTSISMSNCLVSGYGDAIGGLMELVTKALSWSSGAMGTTLRTVLASIGEYNFPFPSFVNQEFLPSLADKNMLDLIGVQTIAHVAKDPDSYPMISCCRKLKDDYLEAEKNEGHFDHVKTMTWRPVVSEEEFFNNLIGITKGANGIYPTEVFFNQERQNSILLYKQQMSKRPGGGNVIRPE